MQNALRKSGKALYKITWGGAYPRVNATYGACIAAAVAAFRWIDSDPRSMKKCAWQKKAWNKKERRERNTRRERRKNDSSFENVSKAICNVAACSLTPLANICDDISNYSLCLISRPRSRSIYKILMTQ